MALPFALLFAALPAAAQSKPAEYDVKAAYLFNFGKFIKWPGTIPADSFKICVLGANPFDDRLEPIVASERLDNKPVMVKHVASVREAEGCQIVFVSASEEARAKSLLAALAKPGILTVSDMEDFLDSGGAIQFVLEGDRVRFQVNLAAASTAGLTLSSQLLKVATKVVNTKGGLR